MPTRDPSHPTQSMDPAPVADALQPMAVDIVSVQSQVVYGQVGNTIAVPALQALGFRVAAVPTVLLSNTPHHATVHGGAVPLEWFEGYLADLHARDALQRLKAVLVGYLGGPDQARSLGHWIADLVARQRDVQVFIDPVMGDHDVGIYVDPRMAEAHRDDLLALADGLVPNGFELGILTGLPVDDVDQVVAAARSLLVGRTRSVVVTSAAPATWSDDDMQVVVVGRDTETVIRHRRLATTPKGTGDLFSATLAAHVLHGVPVDDAARRACDRVVDVLEVAARASSAEMLVYPDPPCPRT